MKITKETSRTFAEYRFIPRLTTEGLKKEKINLATTITKDTTDRKGIRLELPVISAAMQAVTGREMAIALAQQGGLGVLYRSQTIEDEARMIRSVKRARSGFASRLEVTNPNNTITDLTELIERTGYNTIPVVEGDKTNYGKLLGIIEGPIPKDIPTDEPVIKWMRKFRQEPLEELVRKKTGQAEEIIELVNDYICYGETGITLQQANSIIMKNRRKYMPIVNKDGTLKYMVFRKDAQAHKDFPNATVDSNKRYLAGAAVDTHDYAERAPALAEVGADALFIDSSDGFSEYQKKCIEFIKTNFPETPVIAGNIVSGEAFDYLAELDIDGIKVGMGGGSICITQEQKGTGRGQATAVQEVARHRDKHHKQTGAYIPIISDGGLVNAKDIAMALAFGADAVMMGRYFAGCHESPPPIIERDGKRYKEYWGEGSQKAKAWSEKRYGQSDFDEGVVSYVPYTGRVADNLVQTFAKISATMISCGASNIKELQEKAMTELISEASRAEGGVHDVEEISKERR